MSKENTPPTGTPPGDVTAPIRGEGLTGKYLFLMGQAGVELARVVRDYLPLQGEADNSPWADARYRQAAALYEHIERIRNPARLPYSMNRHCIVAFTDVPCDFDRHDYLEFGDALDYLCEVYGWQGLSDGSGGMGRGGQPGEKPPPVMPAMVRLLEKAASQLVAKNAPDRPGFPRKDSLMFQALRRCKRNEDPARKRRPCYDRDHLWLKWVAEEGLTPVPIIKRWNAECAQYGGKRIEVGANARDLVKKALKRARDDLNSEKK